MSREPTQDDLQQLVNREVHYCVSHLVATLASHSYTEHGALLEVMEQAAELAAPVDDYEEAATQEGWQVEEHSTLPGIGDKPSWYAWKIVDGTKRIFSDYESAEDAWRGVCDENSIEPYNREVFEHWIVSDWLADKLAEQGEKVDKDFAGMTVWARTCSGQSIILDDVITRVWQALHKED